MAAGFETLDPDSLVKITPIVKDANNQVSHGVAFYMTLAEFSAGALPPAALATRGVVQQGVFVAAAAVPFADLTAAANAFNNLRTSLINAGVLAAS